MKKGWLVNTSFLLIILVLLAGCVSAATPVPGASPVAETPPIAGATATVPAGTPAAGAATVMPGTPVSISFWSAPNPPQEAFWSEMAQAYMKDHPNVKIEVRAMPEAPTSEAGIQAAIAGGNPPTASENVFTGFGGTLSQSQAIVPLEDMPGWNDLISARNMSKTISAWKFPDDHYYVLPIYSNAILWAWRIDILKELGVNEPPKTYADVLALGQKLKAKSPDRYIWARQPLTQDTWYERWFDFFILYYAASNGKPLIEGSNITADDQAAVQTLTFLQDLQKNNLLLTQQVTDPFENGVAVGTQLGPWTFSAWAERFPNLKLNETYVLTPPPAPQAGDQVKTFADAKGIVMYAKSSPEQKQAMWDFIKWVFSDPQHDLSWLQRTNLPPARDDLATNQAFQAYFGQHPELLAYAQQLPNGVPPISNPNFTDIQITLGQQAVIPVVLGQKQPQQAWDDFKNAVQPMIK